MNGKQVSILAVIAAGLYWAFRSTGKQGVDTQITNSFIKAGFDNNNARWWAAVSRFETANYTSTLAVKYNNYFGMTWPGQTGINKGQAGTTNFVSYATVQDSINDAIAWIKMNGVGTSYPTLNSLIYAMYNADYFTEDPNTYFLGVQADLKNVH